MTDQFLVSPEAKAEAATWLARLHAGDRSPADESAFQAWLAADRAHTAAFEAVTTTWEIAGGLRELRSKGPPQMPVRRRAVLAGIGALAASMVGFEVWQRAYAGVYQTDVGEQKHVTLQDGTQAFLDTDTCIRAQFTDTVRGVELVHGRCNFHVAPDGKRPFVVDAAAERIMAAQTNFDVRRDGTIVSVVLVQGNPAIVSNRASRKRKVITTGERLMATAGALHVDRPSLAPLLAWQTGQAMFENETLADAVTEMNRYSSIKLRIADGAVGRLRISGVYRVGDNAAFARSIATLLPVEAHFGSGQVQLVADSSGLSKE